MSHSSLLRFAFSALLLSLSFTARSEEANALHHIVPAPQHYQPAEGHFQLSPTTTLYTPDKEALPVAQLLAEKLSAATGYPIKATQKKQKGCIALQLSRRIKGNEAYQLRVAPKGVEARASSPAGLFYAMQTFLQLLPPEIESPVKAESTLWKAPSCLINDAPRFAYRGALIDVCRHFFTIDQLKRQIDLLASYKINYLNLHLTEDQGWRVEIKKYPLLTQVGAWREDGDGRYGGYYTQEQLRELVRYAALRGMNIVPEFEMPGHELAAIASYPWLSCQGAPLPVRNIWGIEPVVMCPGKESTFQFLQDVVDELVNVFPCSYFHIGGDESPRTVWHECPLCQHRADSLGLKDREGRSREAQLQSYLIGRMQQYLQRYHRRLIGWDEILEGGNLSPETIVMTRWDKKGGGLQAAIEGRPMIMAWSGHGMYLDYYQGDALIEPVAIGSYAPLAQTYGFDPVPAPVREAGRGENILGPQCNLWTEFIGTEALYDYRLYPRALAMAEVAWTQPEKKDFADFCRRIDEDEALRLHLRGVNFHIPLPEQPGGSFDYEAFTDQITLSFQTSRPLSMVYTADGSDPTILSNPYTAPLTFRQTSLLKIASVLPCGLMSPVRTIHIEKQQPHPARPASEAHEPGLNLQVAQGRFLHTADLAHVAHWDFRTVERTTDIPRLDLPRDYAAVARGLVHLEHDGVYYFKSNFAEVWIDGQKVVDRDREVVKRHFRGGRSMALKAGYHALRIVFLGHVRDMVSSYNDTDGRILLRLGREGEWKPLEPQQLYH